MIFADQIEERRSVIPFESPRNRRDVSQELIVKVSPNRHTISAVFHGSSESTRSNRASHFPGFTRT